MAGIELEGDNDDAANLANELLAEPPEKGDNYVLQWWVELDDELSW